MKISTFGARHYSGQVARIDAGFVELGHELVSRPESADLVYVNNGFSDIVQMKRRGAISGKVIFTVLDVPEHNLATFDLKGMESDLKEADAICSISQFVQGQVRHYFKRESHVIYQPIMPITRSPAERDMRYKRFLHCGRRFDFNKRFSLGAQALQVLGVIYGQLALTGHEHVQWGEFFGELNEVDLNKLFNSVDYVMATSRVEGLSLPVIEAMAAGVIPVVCNDMTTRTELLPPDLFPEYNDVDPTPASVARFVARFMNDNEAMGEMKERLNAHYLATWKDRTSGVAVARKIVEVYQTL